MKRALFHLPFQMRRWCDQVRMAEAQALLSDRRLGVEEVGYLLGYSEERAFRRAFKRVTGLTPAAWRRAL